MNNHNLVTALFAGCVALAVGGAFAYYNSISDKLDPTQDEVPANVVADDSKMSTEHKVMKPVSPSDETSAEDEADAESADKENVVEEAG